MSGSSPGGGEVGAQAGVRSRSLAGSQGALASESVAKRASAGDDGAEIGASALGPETRSRLRRGWTCLPATEGRAVGRTCSEGHDMVRRDGEDRQDAVRPP